MTKTYLVRLIMSQKNYITLLTKNEKLEVISTTKNIITTTTITPTTTTTTNYYY